MEKKIEGRWDCKYCGKKGIGGLTKHCPGCGHPQDKDVRFYMPDKIEYLDEEVAKNYGNGADWICSYCNSYNRYHAKFCVNCGASREEMEGDYFSTQKKEIPDKVPKTTLEMKASNHGSPKTLQEKSKIGLYIGILMSILMVIAGFLLLMPKNMQATVQDKSWQRNIAIEDYLTVKESDWTVPEGGRVYKEKQEIHHYDQVIDHYETVEVEKTRTVQDGYDTSVEYINNGDGTFSEKTVQTPKYKTETYYETEQRPVYKDVPRYQTKYYYEIERWKVTRNVETKGKEEEPYWGKVTLTGKERKSGKTEEYTIIFSTEKKDYTTEVPLETWQALKKGKNVEITVQAGSVVKINGNKIEIP